MFEYNTLIDIYENISHFQTFVIIIFVSLFSYYYSKFSKSKLRLVFYNFCVMLFLDLISWYIYEFYDKTFVFLNQFYAYKSIVLLGSFFLSSIYKKVTLGIFIYVILLPLLFSIFINISDGFLKQSVIGTIFQFLVIIVLGSIYLIKVFRNNLSYKNINFQFAILYYVGFVTTVFIEISYNVIMKMPDTIFLYLHIFQNLIWLVIYIYMTVLIYKKIKSVTKII